MNDREEIEEELPPALDHPQLRDTENGPELSYELSLLEEYYGEPDDNGVYGGCEE